jgi:hypothetical protein
MRFRAAVWLLMAVAPGCASALRERVTPFPPSIPQVKPWALNRELLLPVNRRILFVVDLAAGHEPERAALDGLARLAARYGERPASWVICGGAGAPPVRWQGDTPKALGPLDADTTYVFVRYLGGRLPAFGESTEGFLDGHRVYHIRVNQELHRQWSWLIPERHLEQQTLTHEYGHLIGLPTSENGYYPEYPKFDFGAHCVNPDCALAMPRVRSLLYGLGHVIFAHHYLEDYCAACRAAIAAAKGYWRRQPFACDHGCRQYKCAGALLTHDCET